MNMKHIVAIPFLVLLFALLKPAHPHAAELLVTPLVAMARQDLRFQMVMQGDPGPDAVFTAGTERVGQIRINPDIRPGHTPGNCSTYLLFAFGPLAGWGVDLDITGPDTGWTYPNLFACSAATALKPGDYIVSLDYQVANGDGSSTLRSIDVPITVLGDRDSDGVPDPSDNCPDNANPDQADSDHDGKGDACDPIDNDRDDDGVEDPADNCPDHFNPSQVDSDGDGLGDTCDPDPFDRDNDDVNDDDDNCPTVFNPFQDDSDGDGEGDACETDLDNDGVLNPADNCPAHPNADQLDSDLIPDGLGDACDPPDSDGDRLRDIEDNCPAVANANQADSNADGEGDACDQDDTDADGIPDSADNCAAEANPFQEDTDNDGLGNVCETDDSDGDGFADGVDNCPAAFNPGQFDEDQNGIGDICDLNRDPDNDGIPDATDNCDLVANPGQEDANGNGIGNVCDLLSDSDSDGLTDAQETQTGTDPSAFTLVQPGINTYSDGQPTGSANGATSGEAVGVAISAPDNVDAVQVTVTDPNGAVAFQDTLIPQSPVVFSFTPQSAGRWRIIAGLYENSVLLDTLVKQLTVLPEGASTPKSRDDCKKDGWQTLYRADGSPFKNQGACVSYVNTGK